MWAVIGYVLLGLLAVLLGLLIVPVYARFTFQGDARLCIRVWGVPVYRFPSAKPKADKPSTVKKAKPKPADKPSFVKQLAEQLKTDGVGTTLRFFEQLAALAGGTAYRVLKAVTVDRLQLQLTITGEDAAVAAQNTGKVCAVLYPAVTAVQQTLLRMRKRAVTVTPDFLGDTNRVTADVTAHVMPLRILCILLCALVRYNGILEHKKEVSQHGKQSAESHGTVH